MARKLSNPTGCQWCLPNVGSYGGDANNDLNLRRSLISYSVFWRCNGQFKFVFSLSVKAHTQFHHFDGAGGQCSFSAFWQGARICHNGPQAWIKISGNTQTCAHYGHTNTLIFTILFTVLWLTIHTVMIYICYYIYTCELVAISGFWHSPIAIIRSVYRCLFSEGNDLCLGGHEVSAQYLRPARCCVGKRKQLRLQNLRLIRSWSPYMPLKVAIRWVYHSSYTRSVGGYSDAWRTSLSACTRCQSIWRVWSHSQPDSWRCEA